MKPHDITYDICRCYITDNKSTVPADLWNKISGFLRSRSLDRLASCTSLTSPNVVGQSGWRTLMQVEAFFKKNTAFASPVRARAAAMSSFNRGELLCRLANKRLDYYYFQPDRRDPDLELWITKMQSDLSRILGPFEPFLAGLPDLVRVTAGATSTMSRRRSVPHLRVSKRPHATRRASPYLDALSRYYGYGGIKVREVTTNRVEFVPKNWKTERTIACEPEGNMFLQLAFDKYAKRRLKRIGVNLASQFRNQYLAKRGSEHGLLSTIDLSMASDTLAFNAVALLFPQEWVRYLVDVRSAFSRGQMSVKYAKFSSMGNGATFSLETLVFAAAARAVGSKTYAIYGDDIVIETVLVDDLKRLLRFLGFRLNQDKSFQNGPFRESCGTNWFLGVDVTPRYIRELDCRKATLCHLVNSLMTITYPGEALWDYLLSLTKRTGLPLVPFNENTMSGVFIDTPTARRLGKIRNHGKWGYWVPKVKHYIPVVRNKESRDIRSLFLWHLDASRRSGVRHVRSRGSTDSLRLLIWYLTRTAHGTPTESVERSRYTSSSHRFRLKWVHWREPVAGAPPQLESWSECFLPER